MIGIILVILLIIIAGIILYMFYPFIKTPTWIHIKTGKPYKMVSNKCMLKYDGKWYNDFVIYKPKYENKDAEYFIRTIDDFYSNFERKL